MAIRGARAERRDGLSAEVPRGEHLRVDLQEPRGDRHGRRVVHLLAASPNRVVLQRADELHLRQRGLASRLRSRRVAKRRGGRAGSVEARRRDGTGVGVRARETNAAGRWRSAGCRTSTDAEHPGLIEGLAFATVHRAEDPTRDRVARRTKRRALSRISRTRWLHEAIFLFLLRARGLAHLAARLRSAPARRRGRCSRRRWRPPRRARPSSRGRHRGPGSAGRDAADSPMPTRPRFRPYPRGLEDAGRRGSPPV